jgi:WD40 repeat protein
MLYAAAAQQLDTTQEGDWLLLSLDLSFGATQRVLAPIDPATLMALRTSKALLSSDRTGGVQIWDPSSGQLLASRHVRHPLIALAASETPYVIASVDSTGAVALWNLEDPAEPHELAVAGADAQLRRPAAFGFTADGTQLVALTSSGLLYTFDVAARTRPSVASLRAVSGSVPWSRGSAIRIAAARLLPEEVNPGTLLVAVAGEGVARVQLETMHGETVVPGAEIPGTATAVTEAPYAAEGKPMVVVATTAGTVYWTAKYHNASFEATGPDVGLALHESTLTVASARGISSYALGQSSIGATAGPFGGRPPRALVEGPGGAVEVGRDGSISLLGGEDGVNLSTSSSEASTIAQFGPEGNLLETAGPANDVQDLVAVRPGTAHGAFSNQVVRTYRFSSRWLQEAGIETRGWFIDAGELNSQYVVAGGQDPSGTAVVLVWDAKTGRPLRRLALTESVPPGAPSTYTPPSIVPQVALLPKRHLIAAYSALQELIVLWSTTTWQRVGTIDVGPIGGFSVDPSESTILALSLSDTQSGLDIGNGVTRLQFIGVESAKIESEVSSDDTELAGYEPDGNIVELQAGSVIRQLTPDAGEEVGQPLELEVTQPKSLAWQPGTNVVAVGLAGGLVRLVDLATGAVSAKLGTPTNEEAVNLSFSPNGHMLVATNGVDEGASGLVAQAPSLWNVGDAQLRRQACALAGGSATRAEWHIWTRAFPYVHVCAALPPAKPTRPAGAGLAGRRLQIAFQHGETIEVAPAHGPAVAVVRGEAATAPVQFAWTAGGTLAWTGQGLLHAVEPGSTPRSAPCACTAVVGGDGQLVALETSGKALVRFTPGMAPIARISTPAIGASAPSLLGVAAGQVVLAAPPSPQSVGAPSVLYTLARDGRWRRLRANPHGGTYLPGAVSPSGTELAMIVFASSSAPTCADSEKVAVLNVRSGRLRFPHMPSGLAMSSVRSLEWPARGGLEAAIAPGGCDNAANLPKYEPEATTYLLRGGRFVAGEPAGYDTQHGALVSARMPGPVASGLVSGSLTLSDLGGGGGSSSGTGGGTSLAAGGVLGFSVLP